MPEKGPTASEADVWEILRMVFDPELPVSIVDLGLAYDIRIEGKSFCENDADHARMRQDRALPAMRRIASWPCPVLKRPMWRSSGIRPGIRA